MGQESGYQPAGSFPQSFTRLKLQSHLKFSILSRAYWSLVEFGQMRE